MLKATWKRLAPIAAALLAGPAIAQDHSALINALIRKGILTTQEAQEITAEVKRESAAVTEVRPGARHTDRLSVGMRMQVQYAHLETDVSRGPAPAATDHFFLRRMYLTLKAGLGPQWAAVMTYDFAGAGFDDAIMEWMPRKDLTFDFGLRKVNVAYEEQASSGDIRGLERSSVTRYFVESNNGRRLGAASYRIGAFVDGERGPFVYGAAITTPERNEDFDLASASGDRTNRQPALWANLGLAGKRPGGSWLVGVGAGHLPEQGGFGRENLGRGSDLGIYSLHTDVTAGRFSFLGELLAARVERGAADGRTAQPLGFFLQPAFLLTPKLEAVLRYAYLDTDGRGVTLSDFIRSAPSGGTMDKAVEWYAGANWYLMGNDLKYQLGFVHGETRDTVSGAPAEAKTVGVRSQLQMQF